MKFMKAFINFLKSSSYFGIMQIISIDLNSIFLYNYYLLFENIIKFFFVINSKETTLNALDKA